MSPARRKSADRGDGWRHLTSRFFDVVAARGLTDAERAEVSEILQPALRELFFAQSPADQRHGLESARYVMTMQTGPDDLVVAALLHDVGKRHARLGVPGRVLASLLARTQLRLSPRFQAYRDHGPVAADELAELGAPQVAVHFARNHHGSRPSALDPAAWQLLVASDQPAKTREAGGSGISSLKT